MNFQTPAWPTFTVKQGFQQSGPELVQIVEYRTCGVKKTGRHDWWKNVWNRNISEFKVCFKASSFSVCDSGSHSQLEKQQLAVVLHAPVLIKYHRKHQDSMSEKQSQPQKQPSVIL